MRKLKLREGKSHAQATQLLVCMISQPSTPSLRMGSLLHTIKTLWGSEISRSLGPRTPGRGALAPKGLDPHPGRLWAGRHVSRTLVRTVSATRGAKQLHSLIARSCQKHMYLQTSRHPAKLQPRMVAKHSLAGWPRRWFPGRYWSPDWHHLSYGGQEPSRATAGRQVHSEGRLTGQAGRAIPILSGCFTP